MTDEAERFGALFTGGTLIFVGFVVQLGINFVAKLVIARTLGRFEYGAVSLGVTVMITAGVLVLVGTDTGIGRFLPRHDSTARRRGILVSAISVVVPLASAVGVGIALLAGPVSARLFGAPEIEPVLRVFGLAVPFVAFFRLTIGSIRGMQEVVPRVVLQNVLLPVVRFSLLVTVLVLGFGSTGIAWAYAVAYGVVAGGSFVYLVRRTPLFADVVPQYAHRELLSFSAPLMVTATMNMILSNVDIFILGIFTTTGEVGVYNVAYPLASFLTVLLGSFGFLFMPTISELHAGGDVDAMRRTYLVVAKWIFLLTLPTFLVFVTYPGVIIGLTFGAEYTPGAASLAVLAVGFFVQAAAGPCGKTLTAIGRTRTIMYDNASVAMVNLVLNLILVPRFSLFGAAIATMVGYVLMNVLYLVQLYRIVEIHPFRRETFVPGVLTAVIWVAITRLLQATYGATAAGLLGAVIVFAVIYPIVVVRFGGIEREELDLLERADERIGVSLTSVRRVVKRFADVE